MATKKVYFWTLKDKSINAYKERELLNFVGQAVYLEGGGYSVRGREETEVCTVQTRAEAERELQRLKDR